MEVQTESDNVTEGDWILFICGSCIPSVTATYIWRKNGHLHSQHHGENLLYLESVGMEDRGRYLCTISGHEGLNSTSVDITVRPVCKWAESFYNFILKHLTCSSENVEMSLEWNVYESCEKCSSGSETMLRKNTLNYIPNSKCAERKKFLIFFSAQFLQAILLVIKYHQSLSLLQF